MVKHKRDAKNGRFIKRSKHDRPTKKGKYSNKEIKESKGR